MLMINILLVEDHHIVRNGLKLVLESDARNKITHQVENGEMAIEVLKEPNEIDLVSGHLTATAKDALEIENWAKALNRDGKDFPYINGIKGMIGHTLSAAGSIECVAAALQLHESFIFPNVNCEDINPDIEKIIDKSCLPTQLIN
ncbi:MAG: response regulator, partial [Pedobacter sp.]